jgi:hypothetical protein
MSKCKEEPHIAGLRRALEITNGLIARCDEDPRTGSWDEGWKLGMEEVAYRLNAELHFCVCKRRT